MRTMSAKARIKVCEAKIRANSLYENIEKIRYNRKRYASEIQRKDQKKHKSIKNSIEQQTTI